MIIIADGAAFEAEMEAAMRLISNGINAVLYLPESFEWIILRSGITESSEIANILEHTEDFADSCEYFSWERFFTSLLVEKTKDSYLRYQKKTKTATERVHRL